MSFIGCFIGRETNVTINAKHTFRSAYYAYARIQFAQRQDKRIDKCFKCFACFYIFLFVFIEPIAVVMNPQLCQKVEYMFKVHLIYI